MNDDGFFRIMIESVEPELSFFQTFWSQATYPGQAIESVLKACISLEIRNPIAREMDYVELDTSDADIVRDKKLNVFYARGRAFFPTEISFIAPFGIIEAREKGEYDYDLIREGFSLTKTEESIYEVVAVIERDQLFNVFVELIERLPSIKVFWIKIAADWEDRGREEFWTNEDLNTPELITSFLTNHHNDTVANGHVALTVYSDVGQTNLLIDTHKTIKVLTKTAAMQRKMASALRRLGYEHLSELYSLECGYYHWHYRPARSKSRRRLIAALEKDGFTLWKTQRVEPDEPDEDTESPNT